LMNCGWVARAGVIAAITATAAHREMFIRNYSS
jgi:hypothetical protein